MEKDKINSLASFKEEILEIYPKKVGKKRGKAIVYNEPSNTPEIQANVRTIPGIIHNVDVLMPDVKGWCLGQHVIS